MSTTTNISGGVELQSESITIGGDVVGRDKIVNNTIYGAVINEAPREPVIKRRDAKPQPPRAPLDFFDRTNELAQVEQLITQGKPVAICGSDGAGKSALLRQAANNSAARALPDGVILLEGLDEQGHTLLPGDVIQRWFDAFYLSEPPLKVTAASALPYLSQLHPLILLDHTTLDADQLRPLLDLFPNSPALIARPSALPGLARPIKLGALPRSDAIELFSATSGLLIDDGNRSTVDAICALLNDVPLAVVRAADVVREMSLPLNQAQARLAAASPTTGDTVAIGLGRAAELIRSVLTPLEAQVLPVAAHLPGISIDPQRLAELIDGAAAPEVETAIDHLKTLGLLHANSPRVRLDAGLREFWPGDDRAIKDRLLAQLLRDQKDGRFAADEYCANELGHVLGAIEHAVQTQQWTAAITLSRAIDRYLTLHGLWDAWGQIADRVWQSAQAAGDRSAEAWALHQLGTRAIGSDKAQAIDLLKQALSVRQVIGETEAAAITQHNLELLIPPPLPPKSGEGSSGPTGLSGAAKIIIGAVIVGIVAVGAIAITQLTPPAPQPTPVVVAIPSDTATPRPGDTPTRRAPSSPTAAPSTPTAAPPTETFTPTPTTTPTTTPTEVPALVLPLVVERNGRYEVVMADDTGQQQVPLTDEFTAGAYDPVLSPDGQWVAFWAFTNDTAVPTQRELYVLNLSDRAPRRLLSGVPLDASRIVWSPQSDRVAVVLNDLEGGTDIYLVPIDQRGPQRLTSPRLDDFSVHTDPAFSPDGSEIAFVPRNANFGSTGISIVQADGSNLRPLLNARNQGFNVQQLAWRPGGKVLSFVAVPNATLSTAAPQPRLALINSDGSNLRAVTDGQFPRIEGVAWSPSGKRLAFIAENAVWVADAAGGDLRPIVRSVRLDENGCTFEAVLTWLPGDDRVAYNTDRSGPIEVHTISIDGRINQRLALEPLSYLRLPRGCLF
jgi:Tol biopolymer transport system component